MIDWLIDLELYYDFMYCITVIILCFSYLATWLPFLNKPIDWLIDWLAYLIRRSKLLAVNRYSPLHKLRAANKPVMGTFNYTVVILTSN